MAIIHFKSGAPELHVEPERREVAKMIDELPVGARTMDIRTNQRGGKEATVFVGEIAYIIDEERY